MDKVVIYTDGACSGNPGPGGWGAVLMYGDNKKELSDFWNEDVDIYKNIIKMFSNENDTVFEPITNSEDISKYCGELNRNYIGFKNLLV